MGSSICICIATYWIKSKKAGKESSQLIVHILFCTLYLSFEKEQWEVIYDEVIPLSSLLSTETNVAYASSAIPTAPNAAYAETMNSSNNGHVSTNIYSSVY